MEWIEIECRIAAGEGRHTEFKRAADLRLVGPAVCAFANTDGGVVILGVDDTGKIIGLEEDVDRLAERLTSFLQTGCSAPVQARCDHQETPEGMVHWIEVPRQRGLEPLRHGGRTWIRRERSSVEASALELRGLYNAFGFVLNEELAFPGRTVADIDGQAFRSYLRRLGLDTEAEPQPTTEDDLRNRMVLRELDGGLRPTLYGVMAFGKEPQSLPQTGSFWVDCVSYAGEDRSADIVLTGEAKGRLDEQVTRAIGWAQGIGRFETWRGLYREDRHLIPLKAVREALVNAVVHRSYAVTGAKSFLEVFHDRIDITSPGSLPNHMRVENVRSGGNPRSRNELMANYLLSMGFMEKRGRGWLVMRQAMREFNGTEPEIVNREGGGGYVRVTLRLETPSRAQ